MTPFPDDNPISGLSSADVAARRRAAAALGVSPARTAGPALIAALEDPDADVRRLAAAALGELREPRAAAPLRRRLADRHWLVRGAAIMALAHVAGEEAIADLIGLLEDPETYIRAQVAEALGAMGGRAALTILQRLLQDPNWLVRRTALHVFGKMAPDTPAGQPAATVLEVVGATTADEHPLIRQQAVEILAGCAHVGAVPFLAQAALDPAEAVRQRAAEPLRAYGAASVDLLAEALYDPTPTKRRYAVEALGQTGAVEAADLLIPALADPDWSVRHAAGRALDRLLRDAVVQRDPLWQEPLLQLLHVAHEEVRRQAAWALGEVGAADAVPELLRLLKDADASVRHHAARALERLIRHAVEAGDPGWIDLLHSWTRPWNRQLPPRLKRLARQSLAALRACADDPVLEPPAMPLPTGRELSLSDVRPAS